jgi:hypothetical protein
MLFVVEKNRGRRRNERGEEEILPVELTYL